MSWCGHRASLPAHLTQRIEALDRLSGEPCLIVVDPSETADQALARYMQQTGTQPRDRVTFIYTGVPRSPTGRVGSHGHTRGN
jgi:hypothetical protein